MRPLSHEGCSAVVAWHEQRVSEHQPFREIGTDIEHHDPASPDFCRYRASDVLIIDGQEQPVCANHLAQHRDRERYIAGDWPSWCPEPRPVRWGGRSASGAETAQAETSHTFETRKEEALERDARGHACPRCGRWTLGRPGAHCNVTACILDERHATPGRQLRGSIRGMTVASGWFAITLTMHLPSGREVLVYSTHGPRLTPQERRHLVRHHIHEDAVLA